MLTWGSEGIRLTTAEAVSNATSSTGDAPWDGHSARAAGLSFVAVRTGGFGDDALRGAGASMVFDDPADCLGVL